MHPGNEVMQDAFPLTLDPVVLAGVDQLLARLRDHQAIAAMDSAHARPNAARPALMSAPMSNAASRDLQKPSVDRPLTRFEQIGGAPRGMVVAHVSAFEDDPTFSMVGRH